MSKRTDAKAVARWEHDSRQWAIDLGPGALPGPGRLPPCRRPVARLSPGECGRGSRRPHDGGEPSSSPSKASPLIWSRPGIAPMAVAAIFHLYGLIAMIEHLGPSPLQGAVGAPSWDAPNS
jgi:hypothetical protein